MIPAYADLRQQIINYGFHHGSNHGSTVEWLNQQVLFMPGELVRRDNINYVLGYVEALQLLAGMYDPALLKKVAPKANHVLFTINMAYGPRTTLQVPRIIAELERNPDSRRAVVFVGKPEDGPTQDQPCTTSMQFQIRGDRLYTSVAMRSWDFVKGLPYDIMMFGSLSMAIAHILDIETDAVAVTAGSLHIYTRDADREVKPADRFFRLTPSLPMNWGDLRLAAQECLYDGPEKWTDSSIGAYKVPWIFIESALPELTMQIATGPIGSVK